MPRPGKRENVIPNAVIILLPFDQKPFFTTFDVIRQRPVRKTKTFRFIEDINDATRVYRPYATSACFNRNNSARFNLHAVRHKRDPAELELPPLLHRLNCTSVNLAATPKLHAIVIECVARGST